MPTTENKLVEIPPSEWCKLRDLYEVRKLSSCAFNMLQVAMDCIAQNPHLDLHIYALNGEWKSDGTFIMDNALQDGFIAFNTLSDNQERLVLALNCLKKKSDYLLYGYSERLAPAVEKHFIDTGFKDEDLKPEGTFWYHIPRQAVDKFDIDPPAGVTLRNLEVGDAEYINEVWLHKSDDSVRFVQRMIRYNINVGAFDSDGQLMAWCLLLPSGALGVLQVSTEHRRKGLGKLVVRSMAKKLVSKNMEVLAPVVFTNLASRGLFESLGAKIVDKVYWAIKPVGKTL